MVASTCQRRSLGRSRACREKRDGDPVERQYLSGGAQLNGFARHSEHYATGLVLGDGARSRLPHFQETLRAIRPHAGEECARGVGPGGFGHTGR